MVWTSVSMPQYLATQYDTTQYIVLEGSKEDVVSHVKEHYVPPHHSSVFLHEHDSYREALAMAFEQPTYTETIGLTDSTLEVDEDNLTVVLSKDL